LQGNKSEVETKEKKRVNVHLLAPNAMVISWRSVFYNTISTMSSATPVLQHCLNIVYATSSFVALLQHHLRTLSFVATLLLQHHLLQHRFNTSFATSSFSATPLLNLCAKFHMIKHTKPIAITLCEMSTPTAVQVFAVLRPSNLNLFNIVPGFVMKRWKEWCAACAGSVLKYEKICNRRHKF
jgi:hypothetical protein